MNLTVTGKHLDIGDSLRAYAEQTIEQITAKYFVNPIDANVVISKEKQNLFAVDISIHLGSGMVLEAHDNSTDVYPAFDAAAKTISKRLMRYKDKIKDHHQKDPVSEVVANYSMIQAAESEELSDAEGGSEAAIIAETAVVIQTLAVSDAVMRLELSDFPAMMFKNPANGRLNMVYRRKDGNIGWVDPEVSELATTVKKPAKKKSSAKKPAAKKTATAKKAPAKKVAVKKPAAKKPVAKKATAAKKSVAKKAPAKKAVVKKVAAKKPVAKKTTAKKASKKK